MIEVKSCKVLNGERVSIGDKVRYVNPHNEPVSEELTVSKIKKAGYFIELHTEERKYPFYIPKSCIEKVRKT